MSKRVAGICYIKVDGEQLEVKGNIEIPLAPTKKEAVMGLAGVAGFKETAQRPYVKATVILVPGFPKQKLVSMTDGIVTSELANGDIHTLSGAWLEGETTIKADEGEVELEFGGKRGVWQ